MNRILKSIFERTRPLHDHGLALEEGWSFPSGHASGSMLVYGLLAYLIVRNTRSVWHLPVTLTGAALVVFVGSSRVLLQVHYLSDILAGYACGAVWVGGCIAALAAVRWRGRASASRG
jgi:undecaprenyl-diphosphatase